ncbi:MAG TPA: glyceraldehyde 3-phosphate dehydrogenase NAD-binding domain-containing protein [Caulobacteraceae bacterium]|nr:glyceraldehyde 3-phosphate dehydrogenase NAD-binding domain-containing protein [Caulobacteraceae bacterium]
MAKIAIHGFGRIGRTALKAALREKLWTPAAISDIRDTATFAALFEVDSNYGRWPEPVSSDGQSLTIGGRAIPYINASGGLSDWGALGVDLVVDCTGHAVTRAGAQAHLDRGAGRVLVSAPSRTLDDCDAVLLAGINLEQFDPVRHRIVSMASCTTNALAPVIAVVRQHFGIETGFFSTVHAYTNSQSLTDQPMKDRRDSWAAAENIIPSSSGAARALQFIWSDLRVTGKAYRVPVRTGSIAEVNLVLSRPTNAEEVRAVFREAASKPPLKGIMDVLEEGWPSSRIVGDSHSSIVDLPLVAVEGDRLVSIAAWYDNEWAFSTRLAEVAAHLSTVAA